MHRGDKAVLRLTIGLGLAVFVAYGLALQAPYVVCIMAVLVLCKPGPPMSMVKAVVVAVVFAALVAAGVLMVPLLEHYAAAALLLTAVVLFVLFYIGRLRANPLTTVLVLAFTLIPVAGVLEQALIAALSKTLAVGVLVGAVVSAASSALFPDPPAPRSAVAASRPDAESARWIAWRGTLIVMPVFVLALTNPSFYLAAIMKTVALGQQAGETDARHAGRELVGSTLMGAADRARGMAWTVAVAQPVDADAVADGRRAVGRIGAVRRPAHALAALVLEQRADHVADPARPGDRGQRQRQERPRRRRDARHPVRRCSAVCLGDRMGARAMARPTAAGRGRRFHVEGEPMTFVNFAIGLPVMLLCLIVQVAVAFWCVRYYVGRSTLVGSGQGFLAGIRPLLVATLAMTVGSLVQIMLWGGLFLWLGEFDQPYDAIYHSAVNFSSLGYGDIVMRRERRLLGPLEAVNGVMMLGMSAATLMAIVQHMITLLRDAQSKVR